MPDTRDIPSYPGCQSCPGKPCGRLRYGGIFPGKFLFVQKRRVTASPEGCPFLPSSFNEVRMLLDGEALPDLAALVEDIASQLAPVEYLSARQENYVSGYADIEGRKRFLEALWDAGALAVLRVPENFREERRLGSWLFANEPLR